MKHNYRYYQRALGACSIVLLAMALPARADYPGTVISQGPVGYWRLNETTPPKAGTILATNIGSVGAAANGTYVAAKRGVTPGAIVSEPANAAVGFDGVIISNRVRVPFQPQWNPSGPLTVEFWAKPSQTNNLECPAASVEFIGTEQRNGWLFYQGDSTLTNGSGWMFRQYNNGGLTNLTSASVNMSLDTNRWYFIVGVFDGTNISTYVNGILGVTVPFDSTPRPNTNSAIPLTFGARADGALGYWTYNGQIDEAAVYDVALSPARILAHYQAGTNASPGTPYGQVILSDAPAGYWRFNEPGDPPAANLGTLGSSATGGYIYNATPGFVGPRPPPYPGFEAGNTAVSFDGVTGGYVSIPALNLNTNAVTISGWINAKGAQNPGTGIIMNRSGQTTAGITIDIGGGFALSYNWNDDPATYNWASGVSLTDSDWTYVALVVQPTQAVLFASSGASAANWNGSTNFALHASQPFEGPTLFGADFGPTNLFFNGAIDEVAIFNRALSEGELYTEYSSAVGGVAPQIFTDLNSPANQPFLGESLILGIDAGGTPALGYQWRKNGSAIQGANSNSFSIAVLKATDSASYDVVVTNAFGNATSKAAAISVQTPTTPVISQGPSGRTLYPGGLLNLSVLASGGELHYQWQKGGTNLPGATASAYIVNSVSGADAGVYQVSVTNSIGSASAGPVTINVIVPASNTYEAAIVADNPESWWRLDEAPGSTTMLDAMGRHDGTYAGSGVTLGVPGVVSNGVPDTAAAFDGTNGFGDVPYSSALNSPEFTIEGWAFITDETLPRAIMSTFDTTSHKGIFFKSNPDGTLESDVGENDNYLWYYSPAGSLSAGRWSYIAATLSAGVGQINYLNGRQISGPWSDFVRNGKFDFLIGAVGTNWQGIARWQGTIDEVAVYKHALTAAQIQNHYAQALYGTNTKPIFLSQPLALTVAQGDPASFSAQVEGSIPIAVQWLKDGLAVSNATNSSLSISSTAFSDTGNYQLMAKNSAGTNISSAAYLTVLPPMTFANATNALVLHLKFDGNYNDASGRGNNGTPIGAPTFVPGQVGQALHYSTKTDTGGSGGTVTNANYVTLGRPNDLLFGASSSFSVAFWVRLPDGYTNGDLPFFGSAVNSAHNQGFTFCPGYTNGGWQWDLYEIVGGTTNDVDVNGPDNSINDGKWHHFAATFDRDATLALTYLDGVQVDSSSIASLGTFDSTNVINIGQDPTGAYHESGSADLDDLGVWRRVLSPLEIYEIFYSGAHFGAPLDAYGPVSLAVTTSGPNAVVIWQAGKLFQSDTPAGPWTQVPGAAPPTYTVTPGTGTKFYRVNL